MSEGEKAELTNTVAALQTELDALKQLSIEDIQVQMSDIFIRLLYCGSKQNMDKM